MRMGDESGTNECLGNLKESVVIPPDADRKFPKKFNRYNSEHVIVNRGLNSLSKLPPASHRKYLTTGKKIKIRAMAKAGMEKIHICELEKISADQYDLVVDDPSLDIMDGQINEETKKMLGSGFLQLSDLAMQHATKPEKLEKMNAFQATIISATAYDKFRLSENLSTQNISVQGIVAHLHNEKEELKKAREALLESLSRD